MTWDINFASFKGTEPVRDWLNGLNGKDLPKRLAAIAAIERVLAVFGTDVCETEWGKNLGQGLYEFRVRHLEATIAGMFPTDEERASERELRDSPKTPAKILLRIFFTTSGRKVILLVSGYDKSRDSSSRRQNAEILRARKLIAQLRHYAG